MTGHGLSPTCSKRSFTSRRAAKRACRTLSSRIRVLPLPLLPRVPYHLADRPKRRVVAMTGLEVRVLRNADGTYRARFHRHDAYDCAGRRMHEEKHPTSTTTCSWISGRCHRGRRRASSRAASAACPTPRPSSPITGREDRCGHGLGLPLCRRPRPGCESGRASRCAISHQARQSIGRSSRLSARRNRPAPSPPSPRSRMRSSVTTPATP